MIIQGKNQTVYNKKSKKQVMEEKKNQSWEKRKASICFKCENNKEGYCSKYQEWCSSANDNCRSSEEKKLLYEQKPSNKKAKKKRIRNKSRG